MEGVMVLAILGSTPLLVISLVNFRDGFLANKKKVVGSWMLVSVAGTAYGISVESIWFSLLTVALGIAPVVLFYRYRRMVWGG
jgi:hypothetical protein